VIPRLTVAGGVGTGNKTEKSPVFEIGGEYYIVEPDFDNLYVEGYEDLTKYRLDDDIERVVSD
jgi:hypothetical protein